MFYMWVVVWCNCNNGGVWKTWDETRGHHFGVSLGGLDGVRLPCTHDGIHTTPASDDFWILCAVPCASVVSVLVREA